MKDWFPRTTARLHKRLLFKLLLCWFLLTLVVGGVMLILARRQGNAFVTSLAREQYLNIRGGHDYLNLLDAERKQRRKEADRQDLQRSQFLLVALRDLKGEEVLRVMKPGGQQVEQLLQSREKKPSQKLDAPSFETYRYLDRLFVRVLAPVDNRLEQRIGEIEAVYEVPQETVLTLRNQFLYTLLIISVLLLFTMLAVYPMVISMNRDLRELTADLARANVGMLEVLGAAIAKRDSDTSEHNYRVTLYAASLGELAKLPESNMRGLIKGAFLHDIGKIAISDNILLKPGKLTREEFDIMKTHVVHGVDIVDQYTWLKDARDVVFCHHEKMDGTGYPSGIANGAIPVTARIFAIADVFDALTSQRPYKKPMPFDKAMGIMWKDSGSHFDPELLQLFAEVAPDLLKEITNIDLAGLKDRLDKLTDKYFHH